MSEKQCTAWNLIADTILSSRDIGIQIIRYEDLIQDQVATVKIVAEYLSIEVNFKEDLPEIKPTSIEDFFNRNNISIGFIESEFREIERRCGKVAKEFGYPSTTL